MGIEFDKSLETGNELIDTQHKELISRVNKLTVECSVGKQKPVAVQTLDFLMDYTEKHFLDEEELQAEHTYPLLVAHMQQHAKFVKAVEELKEMLEEEEGPTAVSYTHLHEERLLSCVGYNILLMWKIWDSYGKNRR